MMHRRSRLPFGPLSVKPPACDFESAVDSSGSSLVKEDNEDVQRYWNKEACGTYRSIVGALPELSPEWFAAVEQHRYAMEPFIHTVAQFSVHHGKTVLEVGVGAG